MERNRDKKSPAQSGAGDEHTNAGGGCVLAYSSTERSNAQKAPLSRMANIAIQRLHRPDRDAVVAAILTLLAKRQL